MNQHCSTVNADLELMRRELQALRVENQRLRADMASLSNGQGAPGHGVPQQALADPYARRQELPPLRALSGGLSGPPEPMGGVQYEQPRPGINGYPPQ